MPKAVDITGVRFGALVALYPSKQRSGHDRMWLCRCDCGTEKVINQQSLRTGRSQSCGCSRRQKGITVSDGIITIKTRGGKEVIVDASDYELIAPYSWSVDPTATGYAYATINKQRVFLHRMLMNPMSGQCVDHINGNTLDNRRSNLRVCTQRQNSYNARVKSDSKTGYRGVHFDAQTNRYHAYAAKGGKTRHLGWFDTAEEAAEAYNKAAKELYGAFARLNKVVGGDAE